jgi:iron complex outermembrane receptor protein
MTLRFRSGVLEHSVLAGVDDQDISGENFQQFNIGETANPLTRVFPTSIYLLLATVVYCPRWI